MLTCADDGNSEQRDGRKYGTEIWNSVWDRNIRIEIWNYNSEPTYGIDILEVRYERIVRHEIWN